MRVEVARELDEIRALLQDANVPPEQQAALSSAVETIASEAATEKADKSKVMSALDVLERVTKVGGGLAELGAKLAPHVAALAAALL